MRSGVRRIREEFRGRMLAYTRIAYANLPDLPAIPRILDLGCGSGMVSLELARLSGGVVTGIDVDMQELREFRNRMRAAGLGSRVRAVGMSFVSPLFDNTVFDLLWAEGVTRFIPFLDALRAWGGLAGPEGVLVMHEEVAHMDGGLGSASSCGWRLEKSMHLPRDAWWREYYAPMALAIQDYRDGGGHLTDNEMAVFQGEIATCRNDPGACATGFHIFRRCEPGDL